MKCLEVRSEGFPWGYYMSCYLSRTTGAVSNNLHVVQNLTVRNNTLINKTQITTSLIQDACLDLSKELHQEKVSRCYAHLRR